MALLVWPLLRRGSANAPAEDAAAAAVFRDHKRQLDDDLAAGALTADEHATAMRELVARFGTELTQPLPGDAAPAHPRYGIALVLVALLPVAAGGLYFALGDPAALKPAPPTQAVASDPQIAAMVDRLAQKLKAEPEDGEGWAMLGRSYRVLGRFDAAAAAYREAAKRLPPSAELLTDQAEAVAQAQGRSLAGEPTQLLNRALALDPTYTKALALSGAAAVERSDLPAAISLWKRLRAQLPGGTEEATQVDAVIAQLETAAAKGGGAPAPGAAAAPAPGPATTASTTPSSTPSVRPAPAGDAPGPSTRAGATPGAPSGTASTPASGASAAGTPAGTASGANGDAVSGRVAIDPKLASRIAPDDTVFIFARDPAGGRMPLAAMKIAAAELPRSFTLNDAMAMSPSARISGARQVVVEVRVSKSGQVAPRPGDLAGTSAAVAPGATGLNITIDRVLE